VGGGSSDRCLGRRIARSEWEGQNTWTAATSGKAAQNVGEKEAREICHKGGSAIQSARWRMCKGRAGKMERGHREGSRNDKK